MCTKFVCYDQLMRLCGINHFLLKEFQWNLKTSTYCFRLFKADTAGFMRDGIIQVKEVLVNLLFSVAVACKEFLHPCQNA